MTNRDPSPNTVTHKGPRGVDELVRCLSLPNGIERQSAREHLVSMGSRAVPELINCLSDPRRQVRWEAVKALGEIANPIASTALVGALEDRDGDVRWLAAVALIAIGRKGLRPLMEALIDHSDSDWLRSGAHHVCHDLAKTADADIVKPMLDALNTSEPEVTVPGAAYSVLRNLS